MLTEKEFLNRYFEIRQRLDSEALFHPLVWPNEDWSKLIYGTEDAETRQKIIELAAEMEDTGAWIVKTFFGDYPENTKTVEIADIGQWKIDFPSQLYAFLKVKRENLISDQKVKWVRPIVNENRGENNAATDHRTERSADVAGETGGAGEPRQHGISDTGDPGEYKAGLEIPNYAVDTDESSDWREGLQTL
jgi:hypothetical protein